MSESDDDDSGINITLGKLIAYPVGALLILSGLAGLVTSLLGGVLILASGVIALPIVRARLKDNTGVGINRWAASAIVLVLMLSGSAALGASGDGGGSLDDGSSNGGGGVQLIEQPATELLPTIDDFESGWRGGVEEDEESTARYTNVESSEVVIYNVTVFDSVDAAESALEDRQPDDVATSDVSIGDGGYKYSLAESAYVIQFSERNVVCRTQYQGSIGTLDPEGNAENLAETCADAING